MIKVFLARYNQFVTGKFGFVTDVALFCIITYSFHLIFRYFSPEIFSVPFFQASNSKLASVAYVCSLWINQHILGMQIATEPINVMWFKNGQGIVVNSGCSGFKLFCQAIILFLLFPGPWKHKLWFIPFSVFIMFITNVFRIVVLSVVQSWKPEYMAFCHTWVLRPFFYVVLFGLWIWWVEKYRRSYEL